MIKKISCGQRGPGPRGPPLDPLVLRPHWVWFFQRGWFNPGVGGGLRLQHELLCCFSCLLLALRGRQGDTSQDTHYWLEYKETKTTCLRHFRTSTYSVFVVDANREKLSCPGSKLNPIVIVLQALQNSKGTLDCHLKTSFPIITFLRLSSSSKGEACDWRRSSNMAKGLWAACNYLKAHLWRVQTCGKWGADVSYTSL